MAGLDSRTGADTTLDTLASELRPDVVHVHTVVNPAVLRWAGRREAVITVQDHRYFCPGRGKWTLAGDACRSRPRATRARPASRTRPTSRPSGTSPASGSRRCGRMRVARALALHAGRAHRGRPRCRAHQRGAALRARPCARLRHGRAGDACCSSAGWWRARVRWKRRTRGASSGVDLPLVVAGAGPVAARPAAAGGERGRLGGPRRPGRAPGPRARPGHGRRGGRSRSGSRVWRRSTSGVPVAAWDSGGVREWHPGDGLAPWGDVPALARAIRELAGRRAAPPTGFDRESLMARLDTVYRRGVMTVAPTRIPSGWSSSASGCGARCDDGPRRGRRFRARTCRSARRGTRPCSRRPAHRGSTPASWTSTSAGWARSSIGRSAMRAPSAGSCACRLRRSSLRARSGDAGPGNRDLAITIGPPRLTDEKLDLYARYLNERHDGQMTGSREELEGFLYVSGIETVEVCYRDGSAPCRGRRRRRRAALPLSRVLLLRAVASASRAGHLQRPVAPGRGTPAPRGSSLPRVLRRGRSDHEVQGRLPTV